MAEDDSSLYRNGRIESNGNVVYSDEDHPVIDTKYIFADPYNDGQLTLIGVRVIYRGHMSEGEFQIGQQGEETVAKVWYSPAKPQEGEYVITDQEDPQTKNRYLLFSRNGFHPMQ
ncbi:MAG: hypothetical protein NUV98_02045 [Candidatus Roizmanbacteria bacterium]|nr:hypothetical protein [Candidatus Roizmanbacteria bacterium]